MIDYKEENRKLRQMIFLVEKDRDEAINMIEDTLSKITGFVHIETDLMGFLDKRRGKKLSE